MITANQKGLVQRAPRPIVCLLAALLLVDPSECFSAANDNNAVVVRIRQMKQIKSVIVDRANHAADSKDGNNDATTVPIATFDRGDADLENLATLSYASDLVPRRTMSASTYGTFTKARHADCIDLFDMYETTVLRCEILDENSLNFRWRASWIPSGSTWLYDLADVAGWNITRKSPDPATIAMFSWKNVYGMFQRAFATGDIVLPISVVEGNTLVSIADPSGDASNDGNMAGCVLSLSESIDLVAEADKNRLQNRRVAQELASWIDVSRRAPKEALEVSGTTTPTTTDVADMEELEEWAGVVWGRILAGVPGAGALDVDPNEDDAEGGVALAVFGAVCLGAVALMFEYFIVPEIVGGSGAMPY